MNSRRQYLRFFLASSLALAIFFAGCATMGTNDGNQTNALNRKIDSLLTLMTLEEKLGQLNLPVSGDITTGQASSAGIAQKIREGKVGGLFNIKSVEKIREVQRIAVEESRLRIPLLFGMDVIHGYETVFPIPIGLACTWDTVQIEKAARISAIEASADGICWTFSPMVDISRDPRWGRVSEGAGEDPFLASEFAKAMVRGYQGSSLSENNTIMACVKHFALYGAAEAGRDYNTTDMSRIRMFNEYLPPYKAAVDAGVGSVMTSFNEVDGIPASGNKWLMTDVLRDKWDFEGFVVTDYTAINEMIAHGMGDLQVVSRMALDAGVDMDMVGEGFLTTLGKSLKEGKITEDQIDKAVRRILKAKYILGLFDNPYLYCDIERAKNEIFTSEHRRIAREIASQSFVLLKNENNILPLKRGGTIALVGPLADNRENMTGTWSVAANFDQSVSVLDGLRNVAGGDAKIIYARGANVVADPELEARVSIFGKPTRRDPRPESQLIAEAVNIARQADVIVAAMGEAAEMSGESSSLSNIDLPENQRRLLAALVQTGKPIVLVLFAGRPLSISWEKENIPAILYTWFGGTEAGNAIADVLFGNVVPSGKLAMTIPENTGQIPIYYNHKNTGRPLEEGQWFQKFRSNYLDVPNEPLYPFGFGLSFTIFAYDNLKLSQSSIDENQTLTVTVDVANTGNFDGAEVVQLYVRDMVGSITRPVKELKAFQKIMLKKGEMRQVTFHLSEKDLRFYNYNLEWASEPGDFKVFVGGNSQDLLEADFKLVKSN